MGVFVTFYSGNKSSPSSSSANSSSTSLRRAAVFGRSACGPSGSEYVVSGEKNNHDENTRAKVCNRLNYYGKENLFCF